MFKTLQYETQKQKTNFKRESSLALVLAPKKARQAESSRVFRVLFVSNKIRSMRSSILL